MSARTTLEAMPWEMSVFDPSRGCCPPDAGKTQGRPREVLRSQHPWVLTARIGRCGANGVKWWAARLRTARPADHGLQQFQHLRLWSHVVQADHSETDCTPN